MGLEKDRKPALLFEKRRKNFLFLKDTKMNDLNH
jgi:hypothetical protein